MNTHTSATNRFQQLHWKLTLNYTVVTVAALITVELLLLGALAVALSVLLNSGLLQAQLIDVASTTYAPTLRYFLAQTPPDQEGVAVWLENVGRSTSGNIPLSFEPTGEMLVIGSDGTLIGARPPGLLGREAVGRPVDTQAVFGLAETLQAALAGTENVEQLFTLPRANEKVVLAVPIWNAEHERVLGVLVAMEESPTVLGFLADVVPILAVSLLGFTLVAGLAGTVYGYLAARGPVHRLDRLSAATLAWSQGDFSARVDDSTRDELGQLAGRLNDMAQQLTHLVETRRELAVMDERNRLARELHDSAKQQAFATAAQIGGVRALLRRDPDAAAVHLVEAERLLDELRRELTGMILELRPAALSSEGLAAVLHNYVAEWAGQNDITPQVHITSARPLPSEIEQPLFRILQEALANVARHSAAGNVTVTLLVSPDDVTLSVSDDGRGFNANGARSGFGLSSMQQRTAALGGRLTVRSAAGTGTTVSCIVPIGMPATNSEVKSHD